MTKKHVTIIILACILFILTGCNNNTTEQTISMDDLKIGDYIEFGKYDEQPILWRVIHIDEDGNPLIFSDRIISLKSFDSMGDYHKNIKRKEGGSSYWKDSNIRQWLNSSENAGEIKWIQNSPNKENICTFTDGEKNFAYDKEKGFLADGNFSEVDRSIIKPVIHKALLCESDIDKKIGGNTHYSANYEIASAVGNYDDAYYENVEDKVFLLDIKEIRTYVIENKEDFNDDFYIGKPTKELVKKSIEYNVRPYIGGKSFDDDKPYFYCLRTPTPHNGESNVLSIRTNGKECIIGEAGVNSSIFGGIRPALFLDKSNTSISTGKGTESKPFIVTKA